MPDGDWLSNLASKVGTVGSFIGHALSTPLTGDAFKVAGGSTGNPLTNIGTAISVASDKDPTKMLTGPILAGLHHAGVGSQGDEWDKGAIGLLGTGFAKAGALETYAALKTTQSNPFVGGALNKRAWDMAFDTENPIDFGASMLADESILTNPNGVSDLHKAMDSSWYGNFTAGVITFVGFSAIDPTRGVGKLSKAGNAAKFVEDAVAGDRLATVVNSTLDGGGTLGATAAGKLGNTARALIDRPLDEASQAGHMMTSKSRFLHDTDFNSVSNKLDPMLGNGSPSARLALPGVTEMYVDAAHIADPRLQAQVMVNIDLALTGSSVSKKWLADNVPMIAAKGKRMTSAPSEFTLLHDMLDDVASNGIANFDHGNWLDRHYGTADNLAEMKAYASSVDAVRKFKSTLEHGATDGGLVDFGTTKGGVQVAPRTLEKLKTALNQRVLDTHLLQNGASGRTIRIVNGAITPHAVGSIHIQDAVMGNKQLMDTLRTFSTKMKDAGGADVFAPALIQNYSERFLKATQLERASIVDEVNDLLLAKVAEKYSPQSWAHRGDPLTPENVKQMIAEANGQRNNSRAYALRKTAEAKARGEETTWMGDTAGADTVFDTAHISTHLETTRGLWDYNFANEIVDQWYVNNGTMARTGLSKSDRLANSNTAAKLAWALKVWKHSVLMRPGLAPRAIADTGLRTAMVNGAQITSLQTMAGVLNGARNVGSGLLKTGDRMTMSSLDKANAQRMGVTIDELTAQGSAQAVQIMGKTLDANRAGELAGSFTTKVHRMPTPRGINAGKGWVDAPGVTFDPMGHGRVSKAGQWHHLSNYYEDASRRALELEKRMRGTGLPAGGGKPLGVGRKAPQGVNSPDRATRQQARGVAKYGDTPTYDQPTGLRALTENYPAQVAARDQSIKGAQVAKARYEEGSLTSKRRNVTTPFEVDANGREIGALRRWAGVKGTTWQAIKDDADYLASVKEMTAGGNAASLYGVMSKDLVAQQMRADLNHGNTFVLPTDGHWAEKYAATAAELRGSYTARRLIVERETLVNGKARTPQAIEDSFLNDPLVEAEARAMKPGQKLTKDETRAWLNQLADSVRVMTSTDASHAMMMGAKDVTPEMANAAIRGADRFHIYGPDTFHDPTHDMIGKAYNVLLNLPDTALARVPMYNGLYHTNVGKLVKSYTQRAVDEGRALTTKERLEIHSRARQRSLNDVRRDMYDTQRTVGSHGVMSLVSPFFAPWEDAMMSWSRIIYDNPAITGRLMRLTQTGDMFHVTTTADGSPVRPFDGTQMQDKYISLVGQRFGLGSLNSVQQGNVPFSPGVGPLVQLPATVLVAQALPNLGVVPLLGPYLGPLGTDAWQAIAANPDNILSKSVFPQGGIPKANKTSLALSLMPSYARKALDALFSNDDFSFGSVYPTAFGTKYNDLITRYREDNGGRDPSKQELDAMESQASLGARAAGMASAAFSWGLGISGNAAPEGQLYVDKMHALNAMAPALAEQGLTPGGIFATMYPNAARLNWTFSVNEGRLEASVDATSAYYRNKPLMDKNKESGWWIAGPDNLLANLNDPDTGGKTFSQSAYNQQMNAGLRRRYSKAELIAQQDIAMGYGRLAIFDAQMGMFMRENGIKNLNAKNAGNLGVLKANYVAELGAQFPEWEKDRSSVDRHLKDRQIAQITAMVADPPLALRDRPDVLTTGKYLFARQALVAAAQEQGITSWQTAKSLVADRYSLWQLGQSLAGGDIVFQQAWSRLFESEFKNDLTPSMGS